MTQGLLDEFGPERIRNTPISEIAIVGSGIGAAIQGMRPVVEIMYEDFLTISMEQIVNQAAKHRTMSGGQVKVPLTIRTQGGAGWSPGAQHAQQLEAWFVHVPGLKVVFASTPEDVRGLLWSAIYDDNPVVFFEHRTLYPIKGEVPDELEPIPLGKARVHREGTDVTVVATGRLVHEALGAAEEAEKDGISVEVVDPRTLPAARRGDDRRLRQEDDALRDRPRGRHARWLRRRAHGRRSSTAPSTTSTRRSSAWARSSRRSRSRRRWSSGRCRTPPTCSRRSAGRSRGPRGGHGDRGQAAAPGPGHGVGHDRDAGSSAEGDAVKKGEPLYELDTDKVTQEVEADSDGVLLKIVVADGRGRRRDDRRRHRSAGRGRVRAGGRRTERQR